jgi:hypothetical protein
MATKNYAIVTTKKLRFADLPLATLHNGRIISPPNADPNTPDGVRVFRCDGQNALNAVGKRIEESGASWPALSRYVAFEVVLALSPEADNKPSDEVFVQRSESFLDKTYGRENVVAGWLHRDEKSAHVHALVVPICQGKRPGRKRTDANPGDGPVVSWNLFSGSAACRPRKSRNGKKQLNNPVMAGWQTAWAAVWEDHGFRRGIPSQRQPILMQWIQGKTAAIQAMAEMAKDEFLGRLQSLALPANLVADLGEEKARPQALARIGQMLRPLFERVSAPLVELASRGIQLDVEQQSRAEIADKNIELGGKVAELTTANADLARKEAAARTEISELSYRVRVLKGELEDQRNFAVEDHVLHFSDKDFRQFVAYEWERREAEQKAGLAGWGLGPRPPLPTPNLQLALGGLTR